MRPITLLPALVLILLAGCAQPELPHDHFYRLMVPAPEGAGDAPAIPGTIEVERLAADGLVSERPLVFSFRDDPQALRQYNYNLWNEAPPAIVQDQLSGYLRAAGIARRVVTPELRQRPDYQVVGKIRRFEQVVGPPHGVAVELDLGVVRLRDDGLVFRRSYFAERKTVDDAPATAARAVNEALAELFAGFVKDIRELKVR